MTNEEKAVIQAARALVASDMIDIDTNVRMVGGLADALNALNAMDNTPAPTRQFWLAYLVLASHGSGQGAGSASCRGPVTRAVLDAWEKGVANLPHNQEIGARIIIQTWTELEA